MMTPATYSPPNLGNLSEPPVRRHQCGPGGSQSFRLLLNSRETILSTPESGPGVYLDHTSNTTSTAETRTDYDVVVLQTQPPGIPQKTVSITVDDTGVLSQPENGVSVGVSGGTTRVVARSPDGEVSAGYATVQFKESASATTLVAPVAGSLNYHCNYQILDRIAGKDRTSMPIWSIRDDAAGVYQWNTSCWGGDISNLSCMSPWNSRTGAGGGGALITPRHAMFCHHLNYHPVTGDKIRYVTADNETEEYTVVDWKPHPLTAGFLIAYHDIVVCELDREVSASIKPARALPPNPQSYLPSIKTNEVYDPARLTLNGFSTFVRACHTTQHKRLATCFLTQCPNEKKSTPPGADYYDGTWVIPRFLVGVNDPSMNLTGSPYGNPLGDAITKGSSGAPAFLVINGELVLVSVWTTVYGGFGYYTDADVVNGLISQLGGGYQLTEVDLSGFPTY